MSYKKMTTPEICTALGLRTPRPLVSARAVRLPDGSWWEASRGTGLQDHEPPERWYEPYQTALRDDAADLEREPRRKCGRGWAVDWAD